MGRKQKQTHSCCYFSLPFCFIIYWLRFSSCCSQFLKDDFDYKNCLLLTRNLHKQKHFGAEILIHCFFKATNLILNSKKKCNFFNIFHFPTLLWLEKKKHEFFLSVSLLSNFFQ